MVEIKEFSAIKYNKDKLKKLNLGYENILCPPYDVISEQMYKTLSKNKYNFVHFELPFGLKILGNKKYDNVKKTLDLWKRNKIFVQEEIPVIYVYEHIFCYPPVVKTEDNRSKKKEVRNKENEGKSDTKKYTRIGFFCVAKIDPEYKTILPHEQTKPKPVEDRLNLLKTLNIQTSPVFCLVEDNKKILNKMLEKIVSSVTPIVMFNDNLGGTHKFYKLISKAKIDFIKKYLVDKKLFIADGHHRYKTACAYLNELQNKNSEIVKKREREKDKSQKLKVKEEEKLLNNAKYFMTYICPLSDEGLLILPTHRAVAGKYIKHYVDKYFKLKPWDGKSKVELVVYHSGEFNVMLPKRNLGIDVGSQMLEIAAVLLNETVLKDVPKEQIFYHQEIQEVICWAEKYGGYAFLLQPLSKEKFQSVVKNNFLLPPKTTYFYPKVVSGLCEYELE